MEKSPVSPDEFYQLRGKLKAAGGGLELATAGRIAAQGENIPATQSTDASEQFVHLFAGVVHTGEMRQGRQAVLTLNPVHNHQRLVAGAAAGAVGDGAEIRSGLNQGGDVLFEEIPIAFVCPGGEEFKGDDRLSGRPLGA